MTGPRERFKDWITGYLDASGFLRLDPQVVAREIRRQAAVHGITWEEALEDLLYASRCALGSGHGYRPDPCRTCNATGLSEGRPCGACLGYGFRRG